MPGRGLREPLRDTLMPPISIKARTELRVLVRQTRDSQLPSAHGDVAMSTLRHPPGGDGPLLGLSSFQHLVRDVSPLPRLGRGQDGLLRTGSPPPAAQRRRDPSLLGIAFDPCRDRSLLAGLHANTCSTAGLRRGRTDPPAVGRTTHSARGSRIDQRAGTTRCRSALEPLGGRRGLTDPRVTDSAGAKASGSGSGSAWGSAWGSG